MAPYFLPIPYPVELEELVVVIALSRSPIPFAETDLLSRVFKNEGRNFKIINLVSLEASAA